MNSEIQIAASDFGVAKKSPPKEIFALEALALEYSKSTQDEDGDQ
jgi:hypothetical protein